MHCLCPWWIWWWLRLDDTAFYGFTCCMCLWGAAFFFSFSFFGGENSISGSISIWSMLVSICNQFGPSLTEVDYKLTVSWKQQWPNWLLTKCEVQINTDPKCMDQNSIQSFFAVLFEHVRWNMNSHLVYSEIL